MAGLANFDPNPSDDQEYAETNGEPVCAAASADPSWLKATLKVFEGGSVTGSVNLSPKPAADQWYAVIYREVPWATAISVPAGLKATL